MLIIEKVLILKSIEIFSQTPETILIEVAEILEEIQVEQDSIIFNQGDQGDCMYIIVSGKVKITSGSKILAELGQNDFFGELTLLDPEPRSANAITSSDCLLLKLEEDVFYDLMAARIEVAKGILKILCRRIRKLNQQLTQNN